MREFDNKIPDYLTDGLFLSQKDDTSISAKPVKDPGIVNESKTADIDTTWRRITVRSVPLIVRVK